MSAGRLVRKMEPHAPQRRPVRQVYVLQVAALRRGMPQTMGPAARRRMAAQGSVLLGRAAHLHPSKRVQVLAMTGLLVLSRGAAARALALMVTAQ